MKLNGEEGERKQNEKRERHRVRNDKNEINA